MEQVISEVEEIAAGEPKAPERFYVIETDDGYAVWDDIREEIYVDEEGVSEDFSSEWQAEDYLEQVKKAVSEKEAAEWLYVEQSKNTAAEPGTVESAPLRPPVPRKKTHTALAHPLDTSGSNYCITDDHIGEGAPLERFQRNLDAIRLLKTVEAEDRAATAEEQAVLAQYVGWGGLADFFDEKNARYGELKELLTDAEYAAARESTLTAFYTPPVVIRSIYAALEQMGFQQGCRRAWRTASCTAWNWMTSPAAWPASSISVPALRCRAMRKPPSQIISLMWPSAMCLSANSRWQTNGMTG